MIVLAQSYSITMISHEFHRHKGSGAVIARCSQPEVGWLGWRSEEDETLLKAITQACAQTMIGLNKNAKPKVRFSSYPFCLTVPLRINL